jgi:hypothetical protein
VALSRRSLDALRRFNHAADELYCILQQEVDSPKFDDICWQIHQFRLDEEVASASEERPKEKLIA